MNAISLLEFDEQDSWLLQGEATVCTTELKKKNQMLLALVMTLFL